jgi:hypothetical protein
MRSSQQLATLGKSEVFGYQLKAPDLLESWIWKAVDKALIYIYTKEHGPVKADDEGSPCLWLVITRFGVLHSAHRFRRSYKFCTARVTPSLLDAMKCSHTRSQKLQGSCCRALSCQPCPSAAVSFFAVLLPDGFWRLRTLLLLFSFSFLFWGVCWVHNALLLFYLPRSSFLLLMTLPLFYTSFQREGIHWVTLQYAVLLLVVSTSVKESSAQWGYTHLSPTPKEATKNKYLPTPTLVKTTPSPPAPHTHFVVITVPGVFFSNFCQVLGLVIIH